MTLIRSIALAVVFGVGMLFTSAPVNAQLLISVDIIPPPLPVYDQPPIPDPGYLWVPGYWAWSDDFGYYWVPGTWVLPPQPGLLWTPGYWAWNDGGFVFRDGYWGPRIGFYGGVYYGFGYTGNGYEGGYWNNGRFFYNRTVNNISNVNITNVYNKTVIVNNRTNVSYNGGAGGITARPTAGQLAAERERHVPATAAQTRNVQAAARDPAFHLATNHGHPAVAATAHAAQFRGPGVVAAHPGKPVTPQRAIGAKRGPAGRNEHMPAAGRPGTPLPGKPGAAQPNVAHPAPGAEPGQRRGAGHPNAAGGEKRTPMAPAHPTAPRAKPAAPHGAKPANPATPHAARPAVPHAAKPVAPHHAARSAVPHAARPAAPHVAMPAAQHPARPAAYPAAPRAAVAPHRAAHAAPAAKPKCEPGHKC